MIRAARTWALPMSVGVGLLHVDTGRARCAEPPHPRVDAVLHDVETPGTKGTRGGHPPSPQLRWSRDLQWTRLALSDAPSSPWDEVQTPSGLGLAMTTTEFAAVTTLATSVVTRGIPLFEVRRDQRLRQRHALFTYVRTNGVKLSWRMEF